MPNEEINKVDDIIKKINELSDEEKRAMTIKVRTTPEGIKAYTSFLYGFGGKPATSEDDDDTPSQDTPSTNANDQNAKESQDNDNQDPEQDTEESTEDDEDWL